MASALSQTPTLCPRNSNSGVVASHNRWGPKHFVTPDLSFSFDCFKSSALVCVPQVASYDKVVSKQNGFDVVAVRDHWNTWVTAFRTCPVTNGPATPMY